ncbi:MAG TPA: hypothetical protein VFQ44_06415 [Streptosporangiaceae bacterium]|nr:hypothetical protein [Streptosporangiaceae bacterium]
MATGADGSSEILGRLQADLQALGGAHPPVFLIPGFLTGRSGTSLIRVDGPEFLLSCLREILSHDAAEPDGVPELVYGIFIPSFASFGERIGSLLSFMPFLPFLRRDLLVDTVITLPLSLIGRANKKGIRGSPFAARDPFEIDHRYADALLPSWSSHDLYRAVIGAARHLGVRFGSIAPLATLSIDSPLITRFPDLTYWWRARRGELLVPAGTESAITPAIRARFERPPAAGQVRLEPDVPVACSARGGALRPANAMPDVSPDLSATYTWEDVVSVNYTALDYPVPHASYRRAPLDQRRSAWRVMPEVIAWHLRHGERALLIDVQSSVPDDVLARGLDLARGTARLSVAPPCCPLAWSPPDSAAEPWIVSEELWTFAGPARADAVVGPLIYCACPYARDRATLIRSLDHQVSMLAATTRPSPFLAGTGTHDTIPLDPDVVRLLLIYLWFLPGSIPFLFSGTEHGITVPVNREFGFTKAEQDALSYDQLQMFSPAPLDWNRWDATALRADLPKFVRLLLSVRRTIRDCLRSGRPILRVEVTGESAATGHATGYATGYATRAGDHGLVVAVNLSSLHPARLPDPYHATGPRSLVWAGSGPPAKAGSQLILPAWSACALVPADLQVDLATCPSHCGVRVWS